MKVLVACEYSATVRDAFRTKGHDAWSCDFLPTEGDPKFHFQGDVFQIIDKGWDMMIAHPPCTYLSYAGIGYFNEERYGQKARERKEFRQHAIDFFVRLYNAPIEKIAIENPRGYPNSVFRPADQIVHPYYFGDSHKKQVCLWLKNLPKLVPTNMLPEPEPLHVHLRRPGKFYKGGEIKKRYYVDTMKGSYAKRQKERSRFFKGIANAMAEQWS